MMKFELDGSKIPTLVSILKCLGKIGTDCFVEATKAKLMLRGPFFHPDVYSAACATQSGVHG